MGRDTQTINYNDIHIDKYASMYLTSNSDWLSPQVCISNNIINHKAIRKTLMLRSRSSMSFRDQHWSLLELNGFEMECRVDAKYMERAKPKTSVEPSVAKPWPFSNSLQNRSMLSVRPDACTILATEAWRTRKRELGDGMSEYFGNGVISTGFLSYTSWKRIFASPHLQRYCPAF